MGTKHMNIVQKPFGIQEISFHNPDFDRVHVEAICRLMRDNVKDVELASHATEHGKLVMRLRMARPDVDARQMVAAAVASRLAELQHLQDQFLAATQFCAASAMSL